MKIDDTIKEYFRQGVKLFYDTRMTRTMKETFERTLVLFFHQGMELCDSVVVPILPPAGELPTLAQFRYWYEKKGDPKRPMIAREGEHTYQKGKRTDPDSLSMGVFGPGSIYEIVAIVADIFLVSALDHQRIIGRPVMYLIIDVFSDLFVGMSVSLEGPNWLGAMLALENMVQDKVVFCKENGFDITEDEWPSHHLPKAIHTDQGEQLFKYADHLTNTLNIQVTNAIPYRPDWKGYFERSFRTFTDMSIHWLPDSVNNLHELGRRDGRLDTCLTFYDFRCLLISCILEHNRSHRINDDHFDLAMIEDEVEPYPCDVWKWGIQNHAGILREEPIDVIRLNLLPEDHALVTQQGLLFRNLYYTCDRAIREQWFEQVRNGKRRWRIPIVYDPQTSDYIYLRDANRRHTEVCSLKGEDKVRFASCNWFDVNDYFEIRRLRKRAAETYERQYRETHTIRDHKAKGVEGETEKSQDGD